MSPAGSQTSRPVYTRQAEEGSGIAPPCHITVGFDWLQTAARDFLYTLQGKGMPFPFFFRAATLRENE